MKKWILGVAITCMFVSPASGQSLKELISAGARKVFDAKVVTPVVETAMGVDPVAEEDPWKPFWDDPTFTPATLEGYTHIRFDNSAASKYRYGVGGYQNCDNVALISTLTNTPISQERMESCRVREAWLQERSMAAKHKLLPNWPAPNLVVTKRKNDFNHLPLRLYYRLSTTDRLRETADGIAINVGNRMAFVGVSPDIEFTLKGPGVSYAWNEAQCPTCTIQHKRNDNGFVRILAKLSPDQKEAVFRSNRTPAWDTIFYTIESVRHVGTLRAQPHYEITLSIDKVVLGIDQGHSPPTNTLVF